MATTITYKGSELASFANTTKTLKTSGKYLEGDITIAAGPDINNQSKSFTPSETSTTITYDSGYTGLSQVTVSGITPTYVGSSIPVNPTITAAGNTVTVPSGYYDSTKTKTISTTALPAASITVSNSGLITATSQMNKAGYVVSGTTSTTYQLNTMVAGSYFISPATITVTIPTSGKFIRGDLQVQPIPASYIIPAGTYTISSVDTTTTFDITEYSYANVNLTNADNISY